MSGGSATRQQQRTVPPCRPPPLLQTIMCRGGGNCRGRGSAGAGRRESSGTMSKMLLDVKVHQSS